MKIEIAVVRHENELWFRLGTLLFDNLPACPEFERGSVRVRRKEQPPIDFWVHEARGDMIFDHEDRRLAGCDLQPEQFEAGDVIEIDIPGEFDLETYLRSYAAFLGALIEVISPGQSIGLEDFFERIGPEMVRREPEIANASLLRFRPPRQ